MRFLLLWLLALVPLLAGCPSSDDDDSSVAVDDDDSGPADDDDSWIPDDDDSGPVDDDDTAAAEADGTVPCEEVSNETVTADVWEVVGSGGNLRVRVDTVSASSTFDPAAYLTSTGAPDYPFADALDMGDDEVDCSFPPPAPGIDCPRFIVDDLTGTHWVVVFAHHEGCNDSLVGAYDLDLLDDGDPVEATQVGDDVPVSLAF